jgi:integrase
VKLNSRTLPSGRVQWRARFRDLVTRKLVDETLNPFDTPTAEARRLWAIRKARSLRKQREQIEEHGAPAEGKALEAALADYEKSAAARLRGKTLQTYRLAFAKLTDWGKREAIVSTLGFNRARLVSLRDFLTSAPKKTAHEGGKRGQRKESTRKRSAVSVNRELRSIKTLLNAWRLAGIMPQVDRDAIADALKALPVTHEQPAYLSSAKLGKLLGAAVRHDRATYVETRNEHAGIGTKGTTLRYVPIAPFVAFLLLTGCRRGEALGLKWSDVDLDAVDAQGTVVGEIRLRGENTKTRRARTIGLEVSPALRALLAAMKLRTAKDTVHVFELRGDDGPEPYTVDLVEAARKRLAREYGAPAFDWQTLRSTCATYLTNAPAIFGAATVFMSARQLGHSVAVAERHYLGVHRGIAASARTLEAAMQIDDPMRELLKRHATIVEASAGAGRGRST